MNQSSDQHEADSRQREGSQRHVNQQRRQVMRTVWWLVAIAVLVYLVFVLSGVVGRV